MELSHIPRNANVIRHHGEHQLVSRALREEPRILHVGSAKDSISLDFTNGDFLSVLGPCAIESEEQVRAVCKFLQSQGVKLMRAGAMKPRTSAYSFRGLGIDGLRMCSVIAKEFGIHLVSEVLSTSQIQEMIPYVDVFQVGTRNCQNYSLLHELGRCNKPVILKRGFACTLKEYVHSAEHLFVSGNEDIVLCERGIRTFETAYRNTLDLNAVQYLKQQTHLPVIVDPSHGTGKSNMVKDMSLAAIMAGADGLLVEIHPEPAKALSDGKQSLDFSEAKFFLDSVTKTVQFRNSLSNSPSELQDPASIKDQ